ncbi:MAG: hypothetical protein PHE58_07410 [Candidatus Omnitrophica bacterium]|nr:hypothetical protein [Candidatus Omnitrophota bacterium]
MRKNKIFFLIIGIMIFLLGGCVYFTHYEQIMLLKRLAANQREIENYLKRQEKLFYKLEADIKNSRLKKGITEEKILSMYGEPIFCRDVQKMPNISATCLYRHPTKYFNTDIIYLKFDKDHKLYSWEFIQASSKQ